MFGPSGSGKTIFGKGIAARLHKTGRSIYNGGDVKNDFQTLDRKGGSSKDLVRKMGLAPDEKPFRIPKKLVMPKFLANDYDTVPSYVEPFSFGFQDVSKTDFKFLLGEGDLTGQPETVMNTILNEIDLNSTSFNELEELIEASDAAHGTKQSLRTRLQSLKTEQIISNRYRKDPLDYLNENTAVSLGLEGWRNYEYGSMYLLEFYSALLLRRLKERAKKGEIDTPLVGLWAEFHKLAPAGEESLLKRQIQDLIDMAGRQIDMPLIMDSQAPSQIPNSSVSGPYDFLGRLSHIFLGCDANGRPLGENEWAKALKSVNMLNRSNRSEWRRRMNQLNTYDFLYVNPGIHDRPTDCPTVRALAPLVAHPG